MTDPTPTASTHIGQVLEAIRAGNKTSRGIATATGLNQDAVCVHLLELKRRGTITRTDARPFQYTEQPAAAPA